jgi:hypothetical protein
VHDQVCAALGGRDELGIALIGSGYPGQGVGGRLAKTDVSVDQSFPPDSLVADAVSLLNPSVVCVCGQLAGTEEHLLAGIREVVYQRSLPLATRNLQIVRSQLEPRAGLLGLAVLLSEEIFSLERIGALAAG